jgi:GTP 3',8-cyclase
MRTVDTRERALRSLRLSVTDRCNLRCAYCMPEEQYAWLSKSDILSFEELSLVVDAFATCGVEAVRLTGGEPLLRAELPTLVRLIAQKPAIRDLALTTNGVLLESLAEPLKAAGLQRLTVSLDTLDPDRFLALTRRPALPSVLRGIDAARRAGFRLKLDTVVMRGINDRELAGLLRFAADINAELRFIEYMDVGGATRWRSGDVMARSELLQEIASFAGPTRELKNRGSAPAERFALPSGQVFGIIASTTAPFCGSCDRARLTADGTFYTCLYARHGVDLRMPLREEASVESLRQVIATRWQRRDDRGAEQRLALQATRGPSLSVDQLRGTPHLEMHTRGG